MTKNAHILEYLTCPLYVSQCQHHTVTKSPPCTWSTHFVIALVSFHHHGGIFFSRHHAVFFFFLKTPIVTVWSVTVVIMNLIFQWQIFISYVTLFRKKKERKPQQVCCLFICLVRVCIHKSVTDQYSSTTILLWLYTMMYVIGRIFEISADIYLIIVQHKKKWIEFW